LNPTMSGRRCHIQLLLALRLGRRSPSIAILHDFRLGLANLLGLPYNLTNQLINYYP
jgi:hypothetical protein